MRFRVETISSFSFNKDRDGRRAYNQRDNLMCQAIEPGVVDSFSSLAVPWTPSMNLYFHHCECMFLSAIPHRSFMTRPIY
jgi:hypothetical protein